MALTEDFTFQLNGGVILNSSVATTFVDIEKVVGLDNAPFRETIRDHEGADGGFMDAEFEKGREIVLEGVVYGVTETYLDSLKANYAPVATPVPFNFKASAEVNERLLYVKPRGCRYDWELARRIGKTPIQFLMYAEDPRIYEAAGIITIVNYGGDVTNGLAFNAGFNVNFGGGATPGGGSVTNTGNRDTPVTFVVTGPITDPVISNTTTGHTLNFSITLGVGQTLTVNTRDRTVYLDGTINRRNTLTTPDWFFLIPGVNNIGFGGLTGTGSTLSISFRSAWR